MSGRLSSPRIRGLNVEVLSLIYEIPTERIGYEAREGLGFVGGFQHAPNIDAVRFLVDRIMPRIWAARADVVLAVAGADMPPEIHALEGPGVRIVGHQRDLAPLLSGWRVLVAPLRFGAGVSGKITQALSFGLPAVATWVGAEGTGLRHDEDVLIADTPETFAAAALELYENRARWERLSQAGQVAHARPVLVRGGPSPYLRGPRRAGGQRPGCSPSWCAGR